MLFCYNIDMLTNSIFCKTCKSLWKALIMAKTEKLFTVAGTATHNGVTKARFANDLVARIKILNKAGATNINLVELPTPMTKLAALQFLQDTQGYTGDDSYAVANKLAEKSKVAKKGELSVRAEKSTKVGKAKSTVNVDSVEDAPV